MENKKEHDVEYLIELMKKDPSTFSKIDFNYLYSLSQNESGVSQKTSKQIMNEVYDVLNNIIHKHSDKIVIYNSLKEYMYIDEIHKIKNGSFIRYIKKSSVREKETDALYRTPEKVKVENKMKIKRDVPFEWKNYLFD